MLCVFFTLTGGLIVIFELATLFDFKFSSDRHSYSSLLPCRVYCVYRSITPPACHHEVRSLSGGQFGSHCLEMDRGAVDHDFSALLFGCYSLSSTHWVSHWVVLGGYSLDFSTVGLHTEGLTSTKLRTLAPSVRASPGSMMSYSLDFERHPNGWRWTTSIPFAGHLEVLTSKYPVGLLSWTSKLDLEFGLRTSKFEVLT